MSKLLDYAKTMNVIDAHEHLLGPIEHSKKYLSFFDFFNSYVKWDLYSAGANKKIIDSNPQNEKEVIELFNEIKPFLNYVKHSSYMQSVNKTLQLFYGFKEINEENYLKITRMMNERNSEKYYNEVLKKYHISKIINQNNDVEHDLFINNITLNFQNELLKKIKKLDNFEDIEKLVDEEIYNHVLKKVKSIKFFVHVFTKNLNKEKAKKEFKKKDIKYDGYFIAYISHLQIKIATKYKLVICVHTGVWNDITKLNPEKLFKVVEKHQDSMFDVYHLGIPYIRECAFLGKNYPNVYINMCWAFALSKSMVFNSLSEYLDLIPTNKIIAFGGDLITLPEHVIGSLYIVLEVLCEWLKDFNDEDAKKILKLWLYENPKRLYNI